MKKLSDKLFLSESGDLYISDDMKKFLNPIRAKYCYHYSKIDNSLQLRSTLRAGNVAWPGGYPLMLLTNDGSVVCFECVEKDYRIFSMELKDNDYNRVTHCEINYENTDLYCEGCNKSIESAYGEEK